MMREHSHIVVVFFIYFTIVQLHKEDNDTRTFSHCHWFFCYNIEDNDVGTFMCHRHFFWLQRNYTKRRRTMI